MGIYLILDRLIDSTHRCQLKRTNNRPSSFFILSQAVGNQVAHAEASPLPPEDGVYIYISRT